MRARAACSTNGRWSACGSAMRTPSTSGRSSRSSYSANVVHAVVRGEGRRPATAVDRGQASARDVARRCLGIDAAHVAGPDDRDAELAHRSAPTPAPAAPLDDRSREDACDQSDALEVDPFVGRVLSAARRTVVDRGLAAGAEEATVGGARERRVPQRLAGHRRVDVADEGPDRGPRPGRPPAPSPRPGSPGTRRPAGGRRATSRARSPREPAARPRASPPRPSGRAAPTPGRRTSTRAGRSTASRRLGSCRRSA